jgi:hypothetical protein
MKMFTLKGVQTITIQGVERWIVCMPLSVNVFLTLATE